MTDSEEMEIEYIVLKREDAEKYLLEAQLNDFSVIMDTIAFGRKQEGKNRISISLLIQMNCM